MLTGLMYEGKVERVKDEGEEWMKVERGGGHSRRGRAATPATAYLYRAVPGGPFVSPFQFIPCHACPVSKNCREGNDISPQTCQYFKQWLSF